MTWCSAGAAQCFGPVDAQNRANCATVYEMSNRTHVAAYWRRATIDR
jgi:hypothetical protein